MSRYRTLFLDLDDTLYPRDCGVWEAVSGRIQDYLIVRMGFAQAQAVALRRQYVERYGTTLKGLILHHAVDPGEYMAFVHDVPVADLLRPDPALQSMLDALPQAKWVLTNADQAHAARVLAALDLQAQVEGVIDFFDLSPHAKPQPEAFRRAMQLAHAGSAAACVLADDQPRNVQAARQLGMLAVLVGEPSAEAGPGPVIGSITELVACLPELGADGRSG